jgi:uncharacterized spore protein YtfJ
MTHEIVPAGAAGLPGQAAVGVPAPVPASNGDPATPQGSLVVRIAEKMGLHAGASSVYGAPVEQGGVTVIPVARVRYGFGAGSGSDASGGGAGGGGGVIAKPSGYIEIGNGTSKFHRIDDPTEILGAVAMLIAASGLGVYFVLRGFSKIYRSSGARRR